MKFKAILDELKQKRKASIDMEFTIKLVTEDHQILSLGAYPSETVFEVILEPEKGNT